MKKRVRYYSDVNNYYDFYLDNNGKFDNNCLSHQLLGQGEGFVLVNTVVNFKNGIKNGVYLRYEDKILYIKCFYKNDIKYGLETTYYTHNRKIWEQKYNL